MDGTDFDSTFTRDGVCYRLFGIAAEGHWFRLEQFRSRRRAEAEAAAWLNGDEAVAAVVVERVPFGPRYGGEGWPSRALTRGDAKALRLGNRISYAAYLAAIRDGKRIDCRGDACLVESSTAGTEVNR